MAERVARAAAENIQGEATWDTQHYAGSDVLARSAGINDVYIGSLIQQGTHAVVVIGY